MNLKNFLFHRDVCDRPRLFLIRHILLGLLVFVFAQIGTLRQASAQKWDVFPYKSQYSKNMQRQWKRIGCYSGKVDGKFGKGSLRAKKRWLDQLDGTAPGWIFKSRESVLIFLKEQPKNFCSKASLGSKACKRLAIGRDYLKTDKAKYKDAQKLEDPLQYVINNFDNLFSGTAVPVTGASSQEAKDLLEKYGFGGITRDSTRESLVAASKRFRSLTLQYGFSPTGTCGTCFMINNWLYLENLSQSTGRRLFHSSDPSYNFKVDRITVAMMKAVKDNILVHRRMSAKWLSLVDEGKDKYVFYVKVKAADGSEEQKKETIERTELDEKRKLEMDKLIGKLLLIQSVMDKTVEDRDENGAPIIPKVREGAKRVKKMESKKTCDGFDGSSVYADH